MKTILLAIFLIFASLLSNAQLFGTHHYKNPTCTTIISSVGSSVQILGCAVNSNGGGKIVSMGILFGPYSPVTFYNWNNASYITPNTVELLTWYDDFSRTPGTTVFFNTFVTSVTDTIYGETMSFTVPTAVTPPTLNLTTVTNIGTTTAISGGNTLVDNGATISAKGVCWIDAELGETPTISNSKTADGTGASNFISNITGLTQGHRYYIRAYATNSSGTGYSERFEFTTLLSQQQPELTTNAISNIEGTSAISGGVISFDGNATIVEKGVCYGTSPSPNTLGSKTNQGSGSAAFTSVMSNLQQGTLYYVRAYAKNVRYSNGIYTYVTGYGNERSFTTPTLESVPTVSTISQSNVTYNSARFGGNVTSEGSSPDTRRGICYGTSQNPDTLDFKIVDPSSGLGTYYGDLAFLNPSTTYYGRAWAKNSYGISYGNQISFTTEASPQTKPTVTTASIGESYEQSAEPYQYRAFYNIEYGGNVTNQGSSSVYDRGVVYSNTDTTPVIGESGVTADSNGAGIGTFTKKIYAYQFTPGTTYYMSAYATNNAGTSYGSVQTIYICKTPNTLTNVPILLSYTYNGVYTEFYHNPLDAETACYNYKNNPGNITTSGGDNIYCTSLTVGATAYYSGEATHCNK